MQRFLQETMEAGENPGGPPEQQYAEVGGAHYSAAQYGFPADANEFTNIGQTLDVSANAARRKETHDPNLENYMTMPVQNGHTEVLGANPNPSTSLHNATASPATPFNPGTKRNSPEDTVETTPMGSDQKRKRSKVSRACDQCRKKKVNKQ